MLKSSLARDRVGRLSCVVGIWLLSAQVGLAETASHIDDYKHLDIWQMEKFIRHFKTKAQHIKESELRRFFYQEYRFNPKVIALVKQGMREKKEDRMNRKKVKKYYDYAIVPWRRYHQLFLHTERVKLGLEHYRQHQKTYDTVAKKYQIPVSVLLAILGIETKYGQVQGQYHVRNTLITNSFHKQSHRQNFYQRQLVAFLQLSRLSPFLHEQKGSYAGAMGMGQFIPTSYQHYAVDYDQDGWIDLFHSTEDAIASVANYLRQSKWQANQPVAKLLYQFKFSQVNSKQQKERMRQKLNTIGHNARKKLNGLSRIILFKAKNYQLWGLYKNYRVIRRYNVLHSYAMAVHQLSVRIDKRIK